MSTQWTVEMYTDSLGRCPIERFLEELSDPKFAALDAALTHVLAREGINLMGSAWLTPLGSGLFEFRVRHSEAEIRRMYRAVGDFPPSGEAAVSVLLRVFVHFHGDRVCLLLGGYDKGRDVSRKRQQREIAAARRLLIDWKAQRRGRR